MDTQALKIFVAMAEERNMSHAAKRLGLTQSAVSQTIRQLEDKFGVVLVNRQRRPLSLTPAGLALFDRSVMLLSDVSHLKSHVINASRGVRPDVRFGLVDSFAASFGTAFIQALLNQAATLSVRTGVSPFHGEALVDRQLDIVISTEPLADVDNIARRRLLSEQFLIITPKSYAAEVNDIERFRKLCDALPLVRFNRDSHVGMQVERMLRRFNVRLPRRLEVDTADTVTSIVAANVGWAITTPLCLLQASEFAAKVKIHIPDMGLDSRSIYLLARQNEYDLFFEQAYEVAQDTMRHSLQMRLNAIDRRLVSLVRADDADAAERCD